MDSKQLYPQWGQSLWLEYIQRPPPQRGEFARLVKDIAGSTDYGSTIDRLDDAPDVLQDAAISRLEKAGQPVVRIALAAPHYFALLAYVERNDAHRGVLQTIRRAVRDHRHVATCVGFGPRLLHSTGQAYKGGALQ